MRKSIIPFVDILFSFLMVFICIIFLLKTQSDNEPALKPNVIFQLIMDWPGNNPDDVDIWYSDPKQRIVGFKRREGGEGSLASLSHDDLGSRNDLDTDGNIIEINQEIINIRGIIEGEHIVNAHMYNKKSSEPTKISIKLIKIKPHQEIFSTERVLEKNNDEVTFFRFILNKDGKIIDINELPGIIAQNTEN